MLLIERLSSVISCVHMVVPVFLLDRDNGVYSDIIPFGVCVLKEPQIELHALLIKSENWIVLVFDYS